MACRTNICSPRLSVGWFTNSSRRLRRASRDAGLPASGSSSSGLERHDPDRPVEPTGTLDHFARLLETRCDDALADEGEASIALPHDTIRRHRRANPLGIFGEGHHEDQYGVALDQPHFLPDILTLECHEGTHDECGKEKACLKCSGSHALIIGDRSSKPKRTLSPFSGMRR